MTLKAPRALQIAFATAVVAMAGATIPGAVAPAEAKKLILVKKHFHHGHHYRRFIAPALVVAGVTTYAATHSCYWLKVRALRTDSAYWWDRYNACIGE